MKRALFNFFILQLVVWAVVFYDNSNNVEGIKHATISDTWEVAKIGDQSETSFVLHYPTFQKLTLNENGSFVRVKNDEQVESGSWYLNKSKTKLTLMHAGGIKEYDILQLPVESSQSFIIKENIADASTSLDIKYELTRM
jgi:hypothetical protein